MFSAEIAEHLKAPRRETKNRDFKAGCAWNTLSKQEKGGLVADMAALANTGGGFLFFGFDDKTLEFDGGVPHDHGFDPTDIGNVLNRYFQPPIRVEAFSEVHQGHRIAVIRVFDFEQEPHIATLELQSEDAKKPIIRRAAIYVRTTHACTEEVADYHDTRSLIDKATMKAMAHRQSSAEKAPRQQPSNKDVDEFVKEFQEWMKSK